MEVLDLVPINDMDLLSSPRETVTQDETGLTKNEGHFLWIDILYFGCSKYFANVNHASKVGGDKRETWKYH